jgi:hypothetical protein
MLWSRIAPRLSVLTAGIFLCVGLLMFERRVWHGLWFPQFTDEDMALLGGWVLNSGGILYRDFVDDHGPVLFMLTSGYGALAGWGYANLARLIPAGLTALAALAVACSPVLRGWVPRLWAVGLFLGLTASVWLFQGLYMVNYYSIGGAMVVVVLALFAAPSWLGSPVAVPFALLAGIAAAMVGFSCYCFMPSVGLFTIAGMWACAWRGQGRAMTCFIAGGLCASAAILLWLTVFGDLRGYLAFHIAFGQTAYRPFIPFGVAVFLHSLRLSRMPLFLVQSLAVLGCAVGGATAFALSASAISRPLLAGVPACLLGIAGVLLLNARGSNGFPDGTFVMGVAGLMALMLPSLVARVAPAARPARRAGASLAFAGLLIATELAARHALSTPGQVDYAGITALPHTLIDERVTNALTERIRSIVKPDERFLVLAYEPGLYFAVGRLPMSGFYEYLPWDAAYARHPWFDRPRDLCIALQTAPPPLIYLTNFDNKKIWNKYVPADYMPCVLHIIAERYQQLQDFPQLYIRLDRLAH